MSILFFIGFIVSMVCSFILMYSMVSMSELFMLSRMFIDCYCSERMFFNITISLIWFLSFYLIIIAIIARKLKKEYDGIEMINKAIAEKK